MTNELRIFLNSPLNDFLSDTDMSPRSVNTVWRVICSIPRFQSNGNWKFAKVYDLFSFNETEFRSYYGVSDKVIGELNDALAPHGLILY